MEEREVGARSKFLPAKREMQKRLQGKYEILDKLLLTSGKQIRASIFKIERFKTF